MGRRTVGTAAIGRASVVLALVTGLLGIHAARAQGASGLTIDVGECVNLTAAEERLACYDRQAEAALRRRAEPDAAAAEAPPSGAGPAASATATAAASAPAIAAAARRPDDPPAVDAQQRTSARPSSASAPREPAAGDEVIATITALRETVPNAYIITLDNGQVWRQAVPQRYPLRTGQRVRLHTTKWGTSYRLTADEVSSFIQVDRVQ
jgi:hypothetical protein